MVTIDIYVLRLLIAEEILMLIHVLTVNTHKSESSFKITVTVEIHILKMTISIILKLRYLLQLRSTFWN